MEVRESLLTNILINFSESRTNNQIKINRLVGDLYKGNLENFFGTLKDVFYKIPSVIFMSDKEAYYQTIIYLFFNTYWSTDKCRNLDK